jgi:hypothetical protein
VLLNRVLKYNTGKNFFGKKIVPKINGVSIPSPSCNPFRKDTWRFS